jgi:RNA polymerase sigma-70 factor (ECF subfamily)
MNDTSAILRGKAQNGDIEAFTELFEPMRATVFSVAYRLVGPDSADDVVMETYLKAWQAIPRFTGRSSLKTWLYRIAHNCAIDHIRVRQRRRENSLTDMESDNGELTWIADETQKPADELVAGSELAAGVQQALGRLSAEHRTALLLRYADGLSYADIAVTTGVSIGTVMSRLFNAKRKLRVEVEEAEAAEDGVYR